MAKKVESMEEFAFGIPLYVEYEVGPELLKVLYGQVVHKLDGHCPFCHRQSTFEVSPFRISDLGFAKIKERISFDDFKLICQRHEFHKLLFNLRVDKGSVQKVGQYPSLATISNDEVAPYRKSMERQDAEEFHKAIGLAAHGVGVGSFVYLRRVFERLVWTRFQEFKADENWNDDDFFRLRMNEKIDFLKGHLPDFLIENSRIYAILSVGIHELTEEECLGFFDILKHSIVIILDEDKRKKEELAKRTELAKAIATFTAKQ